MAPTLVLHMERGPVAAIVSGATRLSLTKVKKALGLKNVALAVATR
jgi:prolyl-tRNA editing enzyme YbaK/EbsC (Cys-tRNA(Pro) deacylase)